jgi:carboxyl-terminal processing protease
MVGNQSNSSGKLQIWLPLLFALVLVAGMLIGMRMQSESPSVIVERQGELPLGSHQGKIEELIRYVEAKYVDDVNRDELVEEAINEILQQLDPHSNYISADHLKEVNEQLEGSFDGIGVEFMVLDDTVMVVAPLAGGPSEAVGIQAGDKIVQVEDSIIAGVNRSTSEIVSMLRGKRGSQVRVGIVRNSEPEIRFFNITRDKIPMHSVDIAYMLEEKIGYIKVNRFSATTYEEFMKGLEQLIEEEDMEDLVIDLRHNPGGYLQQATNMLSQLFKEKDALLVYTEGRTVQRSDYETTGRPFFDVDDIVVLIDEGSASASEILAGAIQDHDRGIIVGRRSFGKGLVQEQYRLRDGSALRLTVARYYTPSGRSIQKAYDDMDAYDKDMMDRYNSGELSGTDTFSLVDSTAYYTDGGRVVYAGGGIMPDIFVPIDDALMNDTYLDLRALVPTFVYRYMEQNQEKMSDYDLDGFAKSFVVSDGILNDLVDYAESQDMTIDKKELPTVRTELKHILKARMAKHLFEDKGFYTIWNMRDPMVQKATNLLRNNNPMSVIAQE